jgi:hypothetical protein
MRTILTAGIPQKGSRVQAPLAARLGQPERGAAAIRTDRRSPRYLRRLSEPDVAKAGTLDASAVEAIASEFGVAEAVPIGCVAECYLGKPYEVHVLDLAGGIVEHYPASQPMPMPFERARRLALHDAYIAIEVYHDRLVCLHADGTAVIIEQQHGRTNV